MKGTKFFSTLFPAAVLSTVLLACSPDATAPVARIAKASFTTLDGLATPDLLSATLVSSSGQTFSTVRITFFDTAENESVVSARFTASDGSVMTQSIAGTPGTGERTVDVYAPKSVTTVVLNYMFMDPSYGTACGCIFGPYSAPLTVSSNSTGAPTGKAKGRK